MDYSIAVTNTQDKAVRAAIGAPLQRYNEAQARHFYERLGYACFGELGDYPKGFSRYFMKKRLGDPG